MLPVHRCKKIVALSNCFGFSEKKMSLRIQREMKHAQQFVLNFRFEVNQEISATDQVHMGKWRVGDKVMLGKHHTFPQLFSHDEPSCLSSREIPRQQVRL